MMSHVVFDSTLLRVDVLEHAEYIPFTKSYTDKNLEMVSDAAPPIVEIAIFNPVTAEAVTLV